ncbi:P-loop containing nucleoside triphosphate hydrolase protein [Dacryopinax primogenitus]|uniref:p-loop containing nucleoside triphosphate hydrolase protein n=1 Tax=Dacryopinax primogenitus (strain DJM 731) TaxID=1858805 RepID=M5G3Q4_DACPD|nr:P-loop containing nucleoside triphosphate hydrolase protein [Dacryopinax primogenitus]EJU04871.1 P-loop containing nucleoside triphosphate hydrolase protein [Dacryopinax primogenitus]
MAQGEDSIHKYDREDPFGKVLRRERGCETGETRIKRLREERNAVQISKAIDVALNQQERDTGDKIKHDVRMLLLGASGSGKSTFCKQVRMLYESLAVTSERNAWKHVVHGNIFSNVSSLLEFLDRHNPSSSNTTMNTFKGENPEVRLEEHDDDLARLKGELHAMLQTFLATFSRKGPEDPDQRPNPLMDWIFLHGGELYVRPGWQDALLGLSNRATNDITGSDQDHQQDLLQSHRQEPNTFVITSAQKIMALWEHQIVQEIVRAHAPFLQYAPGFFLDDMERISSDRYSPSHEDILRCRSRTIGIEETTVTRHTAPRNSKLVLYDRLKVWPRYFEDLHAIVYLFDLSCFDELEGKKNRMVTAIDDFSAVCRNHELRKANIIVLFTKVDLLQRKLESGIKIRDHITYGTARANDVKVAKSYFEEQIRAKFEAAIIECLRAGSQRARERQLRVCTANLLDTADARRAIRDAESSAAGKPLARWRTVLEREDVAWKEQAEKMEPLSR